jgi:hypothetical protein
MKKEKIIEKKKFHFISFFILSLSRSFFVVVVVVVEKINAAYNIFLTINYNFI